jgi:energy-converting hydrogenase Eha subunit A
LKKFDGVLYVAAKNGGHRGLFSEIDNIIRSKQRKFKFIYNSWLFLIIMIALSTVSNFIENRIGNFIIYSLQFIAFATLMYATFIYFKRANTIRIFSKTQQKKNEIGEKTIIAIISAVLGGIATIFAKYIETTYLK